MKKIILYEVLKLKQWKSAWKILFLMLLVHSLFVNYQMTEKSRGYSMEEKAACFRQITDFSEDHKLEWLEEQIEKGEKDAAMLVQIYDEVETAASYADYLIQISEQAEQIKDSMLTNGENTYQYRSAKAAVQQYEQLKDIEVKAQFSDGIRIVTENPVTDFFVVLSILVWILFIMNSEYEGGYLQYTKIMARGKKLFISAKTIVSLSLGVIFTIAFYITSGLAVVLRLGMPELGEQIQTVYGYTGCPYRISVMQYLILFVVGKIIVIHSVSAVFLLICICCRNYVLSCSVFSILGIVQFFLWKKIHKFSIYRIWKDNNIFSFLQTHKYFKTYETWNFFGNPVSDVFCSALLCILITVVCALACVYRFSAQESVQTRQITLKKKFVKKTSGGFHLFWQEAYKLYIRNYGIAVLMIIICAEMIQCTQMIYWVDEEEYYYQEYSQILKGTPSDEKKRYIIEETKKQNGDTKKLEQYNKQYEEGILSEIEWLYLCDAAIIIPQKQRAFERAKNNYQRVSKLYNEGYRVEYLPQTGWERLFGNAGEKENLYTYALLVVVFTFALGNYYCMEYTSGMQIFLSLYKKGKNVRRMKYLNSLIFAGVAGLIAFYPDKQILFHIYGMKMEHASIKSIEVLEGVPWDVSISVWLFGLNLCFIAAGVMSALFILFLSVKIKNKYAVMLIALMAFLTPALMRVFML